MATKAENERLARVEENMKNVSDDVKEVRNDVKAFPALVEKSVGDLETKIIKEISEVKKQSASKWVEKAMIFVIALIVGGVLKVMIDSVLTKPEVAIIPTTKTVTVTVNTNGTTTTKTEENGHTTVSTRLSTGSEVPGTTSVTTEESTPAQKDDNGSNARNNQDDTKQSTIPILGPLLSKLQGK